MWYYFIPAALAFSYIGRKLGWWISKRWCYTTPTYFAIAICVVWGSLIAVSIQALLTLLAPGTVLRWIFGYALGWYVAIPNFGLLQESSIPPEAKDRHLLISTLPAGVYLLATLGFGFGLLSFGGRS